MEVLGPARENVNDDTKGGDTFFFLSFFPLFSLSFVLPFPLGNCPHSFYPFNVSTPNKFEKFSFVLFGVRGGISNAR